MFVDKFTKSKSEDEIPLILHYPIIDSTNKCHKLVKSDFIIRNNEILISYENDINEDDEFYEENFQYNSPELSDFQGVIHIIKCSIGTGILGLPSAMRYSGYALGLVSIFVLSVINIYSMHLLLEVVHYLRNKYSRKIKNLDYEETAKLCFESSTEYLRKFRWFHHVLAVCIVCAQIGFLSSYQLFVADNTKSLIDFYLNENYRLPIYIYQLICFVLLTPSLFFKNLHILSYLCQFANVLIFISLLISVIYCFIDPLPIEQLEAIKISDSTFLFFGIVVFSFEFITILNPVENSLKNKKNISKACGILNISFCFMLPASMLVGFSGYWKFGENISSSLILSIPVEPWYLMLCKPFYIISIFISFSLQGFILVEIILNKIIHRLNTERKKKFSDIFIRISVGSVVTILSITIPQFDLLISLIGAFTGAALSLIFPPILNSVMVLSTTENYWKLKLCRNMFFFIFGITGCILGTYTSIVNINKAFNK